MKLKILYNCKGKAWFGMLKGGYFHAWLRVPFKDQKNEQQPMEETMLSVTIEYLQGISTWYLIWDNRLGAEGYIAEEYVENKILSKEEILSLHNLN
jgi:hypothetical protein